MNKRKVLDAARKFVQKGAKQKALKEYERLLKLDPKDVKLRLEIGDTYRRWGQIDEATSQYSKVAEQYKQDGFDARAVAVYKQVLNLDPKRYTSYVALSELYQRMGLDAEAIGSLQTAADGFHKDGQKREALDLLRKMATLDPTNTTSRMKVAELLLQEGLEDEAVSEYEGAAEELERQGALEQVAGVYARILERQPSRADILVATARTLVKLRQPERAAPFAKQATQVKPDDPDHVELLCDIYKALDQMDELAEATKRLAKIYRDRGDDDLAREIMQRLPSLDSMEVELSEEAPQFGTSEELVSDDDLDDEDLLNEDFLAGDDPELSMPPAPAKVPAKPAAPEPKVSEELDDESLPGGDPDQLFAEASVYLRYGKRDQAIMSLRGILAQVPDHRGALEKLGEAHAEAGDDAAAVEHWRRAAECALRGSDGAAFDVLRDRIGALDPAAAEALAASVTGAPTEASVDEAAAASGLLDDVSFDDDRDEYDDDDPEDEFEVDIEASLADTSPPREEVAQADDSFAPDTDSLDLDESSVAGDVEVDLDFELDIDIDVDTDEDEDPDGDVDTDAELDDDVDIDVAAELDDDVDIDVAAELNDEVGADLGQAADELDAAAAEVAAESSGMGIDLDAESGEASVGTTGTSLGASGTQQISDDLEEADFFFQQEMHDEAEAIYRRVLKVAPNHPSALLRLGEIFAARGLDAQTVDPEEGGAVASVLESDEGAFSTPTLDQAEESQPADDLEAEEAEATATEIELDFDDPAEDSVSETGEPEAIRASEETQPIEDDASDAADEPVATDEGQTVDEEAMFDLAAELREAIEGEDDDSADSTTAEDGFDSIFSEFKKGVSQTLTAADTETRYDLGIAYREMGLFEDAIGEFRICLENDARRLDSLTMMGLCALDAGRAVDAVNHFEQALASGPLPDEMHKGLQYDLGRAHQAAGDLDRARSAFETVVGIDANFRDAAEQLAGLGEAAAPPPTLATEAETTESEFESFDDLTAEFNDEDDEDDTDVDGEPAEVEMFESFDDVITEAEAIQDGFDDDTQEEVVLQIETPDDSSSEAPAKPKSKSKKKKISFV